MSLENIQLQVESQRARLVLPARIRLMRCRVHNARPASTQRQQGPVHARIVSLENIKVQVERQCACLVLSIELRQSRVQHWGLVFVALVSPKPVRRARFRVLRVLRAVVLFRRQETVMEGALLVRLMIITELSLFQIMILMLG